MLQFLEEIIMPSNPPGCSDVLAYIQMVLDWLVINIYTFGPLLGQNMVVCKFCICNCCSGAELLSNHAQLHKLVTFRLFTGCSLVRYQVESTSYPERQYLQQSCLWHLLQEQTGGVLSLGISCVHFVVSTDYLSLSSLP